MEAICTAEVIVPCDECKGYSRTTERIADATLCLYCRQWLGWIEGVSKSRSLGT